MLKGLLEMNLFQKWKNRKSKKELIAENARLRSEIQNLMDVKRRQNVFSGKFNLKKVQISVEVHPRFSDAHDDYIKEDVAKQLMEYIKPYIEYNSREGYDKGSRIYTGSLWVGIHEGNNQEKVDERNGIFKKNN